MREDSQLKKTSMGETQPTTRQTTLQTRRLTATPDVGHRLSRKSSLAIVMDEQNPQVLSDGRYEKVYKDILRDTKKIYKYLSNEQQTIEKNIVKGSISKVLRESEQENDFNDRFLIKPKLRCKTARTLKRNSHIGNTRQEKEAECRRYFFTNHKKIINLEEECMLLEYFLKDEDEHKVKTPINYLSNVPETSRHRRLTPHAKQSNNLYATHDERQYRSLKKRVHLKEQFVQRCVQIAKKNLTYRRKQNFKEIEFILHENNKNMMEENILHDRTDEERTQLDRNNKLIRLFLNYQFFISHNRVHEYFTDQCISKFKSDLYTLNPNFSFRDHDIDVKIAEILQYKQSKILHFQDFKELIYFISEITKTDVLVLFCQKFPQFFSHRADAVIKAHEHEIERYMVQHKIKFLLELIFNTYPDKLIGKRILPIKLIPSFLKAYGITEKDFDLHHLFLSFHWMQHYDAGLTFEQFYRGAIIMGVKGNNWKGIEQLLKKIDIKKYI